MTLTTPGVEEVIKTDVLGRMRASAERREGLLTEFEKSGVSAKRFAELSGIKYQTLATWLQKRRRQAKAPVPAANTVKWLEAVVEQVRNPGLSAAVAEFFFLKSVEARGSPRTRSPSTLHA